MLAGDLDDALVGALCTEGLPAAWTLQQNTPFCYTGGGGLD